MRARIELPHQAIVGHTQRLDVDHLNKLCGLDSEDGATVSVSSESNFDRYVTTITLDGPDEAVRPIVTHLMDFIKSYQSPVRE